MVARVDVEQRDEYREELVFATHGVYNAHDTYTVAVLDSDTFDLFAVIAYSNMRATHCEMSIAARSPRWCTRPVLRYLSEVPFEHWEMTRIHTVARASNKKAIDLFERLGFKREATLTAWFDEEDGVLARLLKHECRWLDKKRVN